MFDASIISKYAREIGSNILDIENVSNALIEIEDNKEETGKQSAIMQQAIDSPFNSKSELNAKKIMATALLVAKEKGVLPSTLSSSMDAAEAASIADESISVMKVASQVASGRMDANRGIDLLADKATARIIAISDRLVEKGVDFAVKKLSVAIVAACPPAAPLVFCIRDMQPVIEKKAKNLVSKGIIKLNEVAKSYTKRLVEKAKESVFATIKAPSQKIISLLNIR